jgi:hypothetical protein
MYELGPIQIEPVEVEFKLQLAIFPKGYSGHRSTNIRPIMFIQRARYVFCNQICNGSDVKEESS